MDIDEVGQLPWTYQIPSFSTASEHESGFMRWTDESVKLLIVSYQVHRPPCFTSWPNAKKSGNDYSQ